MNLLYIFYWIVYPLVIGFIVLLLALVFSFTAIFGREFKFMKKKEKLKWWFYIFAIPMFLLLMQIFTITTMPLYIPQQEPYTAIVNSVPSKLFDGLHNVYFSGFSENLGIIGKLADDRSAAGEYDAGLKALYINLPAIHYDVDAFRYAFYHEIGHHVWYRFMSDSERRDYANIYSQARTNGGDNYTSFVSDYAHTNVDEDFAETFSVYLALKYRTSLSGANMRYFSDDTFIMERMSIMDDVWSRIVLKQ